MKLITITGFTLVMLTLTISAAPTLVARSTLSDNTEVFSDAKAQRNSPKELDTTEDEEIDIEEKYDYSQYLL
ncbi:hypothetical protein MAM1_0344d09875 [Mucor ambiguus]|uniref:Secreted protein n=1 Tax=Mucor ambiguus TaxID=91626 RepID=A0A0C9N2S6_9FUNG|nr:hypothetical protein MAM1_0344d09875 [Mucor ambiguus]